MPSVSRQSRSQNGVQAEYRSLSASPDRMDVRSPSVPIFRPELGDVSAREVAVRSSYSWISLHALD
jgi:hypothetical protein